jgi:hypothetical protein
MQPIEQLRIRRWVACAMVASLCVFALSCSDRGGTLSGSLSKFYDLSFERTRARLYSSELSIEYVAESGDVPVRVSLDAKDGISEGTYDLMEAGAITGRRGDENIPRMISGTLRLRTFSTNDGAEVRGSFNAKFATGDDEATMSGQFDTTLEVIESPRGYDAGLEDDAGDAGDVEESDADGEEADQ